IREILLRVLISVFLFAVYLRWITAVEFVYITAGIYFTIALLMVFSAIKVKRPSFSLKLPGGKRAVLVYSVFIIFSGSVATLLLDIDKFMIGQFIDIDNVAYYSVAI